MAQYQFDDNDGSQMLSRLAQLAGGVLNGVIRIAGLFLLAVGLWAAVTLIQEAWAVYERPDSPRIEAMARAIESASHLDRTLSPKRTAGASPAPDGEGEAAESTTATEEPPIRFSYFIAWAVVLMLMLLIGRLAMAAIKTGGELALHDVEIRRFARELVRQLRQGE
jgi:hypothetical protein